MGAMASQITNLTIVYSIVYSGADQRKHQSSALLAFVRGIHRWSVNSPHKGPVTRKMFPFDDVIMHHKRSHHRAVKGKWTRIWLVLCSLSTGKMSRWTFLINRFETKSLHSTRQLVWQAFNVTYMCMGIICMMKSNDLDIERHISCQLGSHVIRKALEVIIGPLYLRCTKVWIPMYVLSVLRCY